MSPRARMRRLFSRRFCTVSRGAGPRADVGALGSRTVVGADLACLRGRDESTVALFACATACAPIPWQLDERDGEGRWALDQGPEPNPDDPPGLLDDNDELSLDGGRRRPRASIGELPDAVRARLEIEVRRGGEAALGVRLRVPRAGAALAAALRQLRPGRRSRSRASASPLGFGAPTPRYLALRDGDGAFGPNLLDRLKVRAIGPLPRIHPARPRRGRHRVASSAPGAPAPIRVLRREYQWVRLASWLRTPIFETETLMTRDCHRPCRSA